MQNSNVFFKGNFINFFENIECDSVIFDGSNSITYANLNEEIKQLSSIFVQKGIDSQKKMAIIAESSIDWILCDLACLCAKIITVPLFTNSSLETLKFQIEESQPDCLIIQNEEALERVQKATDLKFQNIFLIEKNNPETKFPTIQDLLKSFDGEVINFDGESLVNENVDFNELTATIIYTSGTGGNPKGVVLTHENFAHQLLDIQVSFSDITNKDTAISILPFAHIFQRMIIYFYLSKGVSFHIINDVTNILKHIQRIQPTLITIVPRVLEKVYGRVKAQVEEKAFVVRFLVKKILNYASINVVTNVFLQCIFNFILFKKIRSIFGEQIRYIVSGGAKLNTSEEIFFKNVGLPIFQGYGMTECSPVIASNTKKDNKIFTVGKPFNSVDIQIAENGEILVRGNSVFAGYYNQQRRNPSDFFHTGDLGEIDSDGFLTVTGRIKEQFKTSNGKFINPNKMESLLNEISGVENACIIAEGRPYVVALLFAQSDNREMFQQKIDEINIHLDHHEQIRKFELIKEKPTVENNIITPSMKLRRAFVAQKYTNIIEKMYENS